MSRYPFAEYANKFMLDMKGVYTDTVWSVVSRRYKRQARDIRSLKEQGKIKTTSPAKMDMYDVRAILVYRKGLGHTYSEYSKEVAALSNLFIYCDNLAVARCLQKFPLLKPSSKNRNERISVFSSSEYDSLISYCSSFSDDEDRKSICGKISVLLSLECGLRTYELRFLEVSSIRLEEKVIDLVHVKGEDSWGKPRSVPFSDGMLPILTEYLKTLPKNEEYVFSGRSTTNKGGPVTANTLRSCKVTVEEAVGFQFSFQKCRRTFGQNFLDRGLTVESLSVLMGHSSTKTTEYHYARRKNDYAISEAKKILNKAKGAETGQLSEFDQLNENFCNPGFSRGFVSGLYQFPGVTDSVVSIHV